MNNFIFKNVPPVLFLDFDGVFTDNYIYVNCDAKEMLRFSKYDSLGVDQLRRIGVFVHVISTDRNKSIIKQRCDKMKISFSYNVQNKVSVAKNICQKYRCSLIDCAFIGNDINDMELLDSVGYSFIVNDSHKKLFDRGYNVTQARGGDGAIREVCENILDYSREMGAL